MVFKWSTFLAVARVICLGTGLLTQARADPIESIRGRGLVAGETLYLFGEVHRCGAEPSLPEAQIFLSTDGGKTWQKRGPALPGSEIMFAWLSESKDRALWAAGEHTAEGPAIDPFVLVPAQGATPEWARRLIAGGPSQLLRVQVAIPNRLVAVVQRPHPPGRKLFSSVEKYNTRDAGRSWSRIDVRLGIEGPYRRLPRVSMRSGTWRLVDRTDGGFDLQKRAAGRWSTVTPFPWNHCPE